MVNIVSWSQPRRLRVLLVCIPESRGEDDVIAAKLELRWKKAKAERDKLAPEALDVATLLLADNMLTDGVVHQRRRSVVSLEQGVYNLVRFSGSGLITPFLRNVVRSANYSNTPIEASLPNDSLLFRYIEWFPVSRVQLQY